MKTTFSILIFGLIVLSPMQSFAQQKKDLKVYTGFIGTPNASTIGINLGAEYFLSNRMSLVSGLAYIDEPNRMFPARDLLFQADFRYYVVNKKLNFYLHTGYAFHNMQREWPVNDFVTNKNSVSAGMGVEYDLSDKWSVHFNGRSWYNDEGVFRYFGLGTSFRLNKRD